MNNRGSVAIGVIFIVTGLLHFLFPDFYVRITPPELPLPLLLVYFSGLCEVACGIGLLFPRYRLRAGIATILLLVAIFPANIYMAVHSERFPEFAPIFLWLRLPVQILLIALVVKAVDLATATKRWKGVR